MAQEKIGLPDVIHFHTYNSVFSAFLRPDFNSFHISIYYSYCAFRDLLPAVSLTFLSIIYDNKRSCYYGSVILTDSKFPVRKVLSTSPKSDITDLISVFYIKRNKSVLNIVK